MTHNPFSRSETPRQFDTTQLYLASIDEVVSSNLSQGPITRQQVDDSAPIKEIWGTLLPPSIWRAAPRPDNQRCVFFRSCRNNCDLERTEMFHTARHEDPTVTLISWLRASVMTFQGPGAGHLSPKEGNKNSSRSRRGYNRCQFKFFLSFAFFSRGKVRIFA